MTRGFCRASHALWSLYT